MSADTENQMHGFDPFYRSGECGFRQFSGATIINSFYQSLEIYHDKNFPFAGHICGK